MGFQTSIASALLDTIKGCVLNCDAYERVVWQFGDPNVECSTLGVGIQSFLPVAEVADCAVYELKLNIVVAQCCYPVGGNDGSPPTPAQIAEASACLADDVERVMCCLNLVEFEIPGAIKPTCRPKQLAPVYSRPSGGCIAAKIGVSIVGVPCCE